MADITIMDALFTAGALLGTLVIGAKIGGALKETKVQKAEPGSTPKVESKKAPEIQGPPRPPLTAGQKAAQVFKAHCDAIRKDFETDLVTNFSKGNLKFRSVSQHYNKIPDDEVMRVMTEVMEDFKKANPNLTITGNFKYMSSYSSNTALVEIGSKGRK